MNDPPVDIKLLDLVVTVSFGQCQSVSAAGMIVTVQMVHFCT